MEEQTWLQQPDESAKAYAAFCIYRDLGAGRSIQGAWKQHRNSIETVSGYWRKWAVDQNWVERARAYDDHLAQIEDAARQEALTAKAAQWASRKMEEREREWGHAELLYEQGQRLLALPIGPAATLGPKSFSDVAAGLEKAAKLARLAAEMETDRQRIDVAVEKELEALLDLLSKNLPVNEFAKIAAIIAAHSPQAGD